MTLRPLVLAVAGATLATTATAAPFAPFDVRAAGMGGTGVASAKAASAALFNPAMLSAQKEGDEFQFVLGVGAQVADEDELADQFDQIEVTMDSFNSAIDAIEGATITIDGAANGALSNASVVTAQLAGELGAVSGDTANVIPGAGLGVGIPGKRLGVGVFVSANGQLAITPQIANADLTRLDDYASILSDGIVTSAEAAAHPELFASATTGSDVDFTENTDGEFDSQSQANAMGVAVAEIGVALSREYTLSNSALLSVGVTPKSVEVLTYDYTANTDDFEDSDIELTERTESRFDLDVGAVYKQSADAPWQFGAVVKNLVGGDVRTAAGRTISLDPQLRVGAARTAGRTTVAIDLDLTENKGASGNDDTQFLALGAEYDLKYLQLRAGYRANLASSDVSDVFTAGIGLGPIDLTAMASDTTMGAFLQIGFGW